MIISVKIFKNEKIGQLEDLACLADTEKIFNDPQYWAAFCSIGL